MEREIGNQNEAPPALLFLGICVPCNDLPRLGATLWSWPCCSLSGCQTFGPGHLPAKALLPVRAVSMWLMGLQDALFLFKNSLRGLHAQFLSLTKHSHQLKTEI